MMVACIKCKLKCSSEQQLEIHVQNNCFQCPKCLRTFTKQHFNVIHNCKRLVCDVCEKIFKSEGGLNFHKRSHSEDSCFQCSLCEKKYQFKHHLQRHERISHPNKTDGENGNGQNHHRSQSGEKNLECPVCHNNYSNKNNLRKHTRRYHSNICTGDEVLCPQCTTKCMSKKELDIHIKNQCWNCPKCNRNFATQNWKKRHNCHNLAALECEVCGNQFADIRTLIVHKAIHYKQNKKESGNEKTLGKSELQNLLPVNICKACGKVYASLSNLERHVCKPNVCTICKLLCVSNYQLTAHMKTHVRIKPNKSCDGDKSNSSNSILESHTPKEKKQKMPKRIKPEVICKCGKVFKTKWNLKKHEDVCGKGCRYCGLMFFANQEKCQIHENMCMKRNDYACSHCCRLFEDKKSYIIHIRTFCSERKLDYKCSFCNSEDFNSKDKHEVLRHVLICRPTGEKKRFLCNICDHFLPKTTIRCHILHELLTCTLFKQDDCKSLCKYCQFYYPNESLLLLHIMEDHPCHYSMEQSNFVYLRDLSNLKMPEDKKGLLLMERERNRDMILDENQEHGIPNNQCYICLAKFHSRIVCQAHTRACEVAYGVESKQVAFIPQYGSVGQTRKQPPPLKRNLAPRVAQDIWTKINFEVDCNPRFASDEDFCIRLEEDLDIAPGHVRDWIPRVIDMYAGNDETLRKKLSVVNFERNDDDDVVFMREINKTNQKVSTVDITKRSICFDDNKLVCQACRMECKTEEELLQHDEPCTRFFKWKKQQQSRMVPQEDIKVAVTTTIQPTNYEDLNLWVNTMGQKPTLRCNVCRIPFFSRLILLSHERVCRLKYPNNLERPTKKMCQDMHNSLQTIKNINENISEVFNTSYWTKFADIYKVPPNLIRNWHLFKSYDAENGEAHVQLLIQKYGLKRKRKALMKPSRIKLKRSRMI